MSVQGAGAVCVEYLVHSPMIRQSHFQRVILLSGSIFSGWARLENPAEQVACPVSLHWCITTVVQAVRLARQLGCPIPADLHTHHSNILDCLRDQPAERLVQLTPDSLAFQVRPLLPPAWSLVAGQSSR